MHTKNNLLTYPFASIQHEIALDALLDDEARKRTKRIVARRELKSRLNKQPLTWHQRNKGTVLAKDWYLAKR